LLKSNENSGYGTFAKFSLGYPSLLLVKLSTIPVPTEVSIWMAFEVSMIFTDILLCRFVGCNGGKQGWNKTEEILGELSLHPSSYLEGEMPLVLFWILFLGQGVFFVFSLLFFRFLSLTVPAPYSA
jgi:hypothetical protein